MIRAGRAVLATALFIAAGATAGCGIAAGSAPPATATAAVPAGSPSAAIERTRAAIAAALGGRSIQLDLPATPRRPGEAPSFAAAPRAVFQAVLPDDPTHGFISVYEFRDPATAAAAAREQAAYVGSPIGRVQFPTGTQFVLRQVDSTVIFYAAVPRSSPDPLADAIPEALGTIGTGVPVPD